MNIIETLGTITARMGYREEPCRCSWRNLGFLLPHGRGNLTQQERLLVEEAKRIPVVPEDVTAKEWGVFGALCSCWQLNPWWTEENYDRSRQLTLEMEERGRKRKEAYLKWVKENGESGKIGYLTTAYKNVWRDLFNKSGKEVPFDDQKAFPRRGGETDSEYSGRRDNWVYELTGVVDGERFHAKPCDHTEQVINDVSLFAIKQRLIPALPGEGQEEVVRAMMAGKRIIQYSEEISNATEEDIDKVYERERQRCKRAFDELKRKVRI